MVAHQRFGGLFMNCVQVRPLLSAYLDRQLHAWEKSAVAAHSESCSDCQREIRSLIELKNVLRGQPLPGLPAAVCAKIQQQTTRPVPRLEWLSLRWWVPTLALATAAAGWLTLRWTDQFLDQRHERMIVACDRSHFAPLGPRDNVAWNAPDPNERNRHESTPH
jgi:anti-sigma factor RsiW